MMRDQILLIACDRPFLVHKDRPREAQHRILCDKMVASGMLKVVHESAKIIRYEVTDLQRQRMGKRPDKLGED